VRFVGFGCGQAAILKIKCQKIKQKLDWSNYRQHAFCLGALSPGLITMQAVYFSKALAQLTGVSDYRAEQFRERP
jgi:hypothetical protein